MAIALETPVEGEPTNIKAKVRFVDVAAFLPAVAAVGAVSLCAALSHFFVLPMMEEFNTTRAEVLFALSFGGMGFLVVMPIVGRLLTVAKPWLIMAVGAFVAIGALILLSTAPILLVAGGAVFAAQAIGGVLCGPITFQTLVVRRTPALMGSIIGAQSTLTAGLGIVLPLIAAPFLIAYGWRATALAASVIVASIALPMIFIFVRRLNAAVDAETIASGKPIGPTAHGAAPAPAHGPAPTTRQILASPALWILLLAIEPAALTLAAVGPNLIPFYDDRGIGLQQVSYLLSAMGAIGVGGAAVSGFLIDRIGAGPYIMLSSTLAALGLATLALGIGDPAIGICLTFASLAGIAPVAGVAVSQSFGPAGFAPASGMLAPFMVLSALGGAGAGWIRDTSGSYQPVFAILCGAMLLACSAGLMFYLRTRRQAQAA